MNCEHDHLLQSAFADASKDLEGDAFTAVVIARTRRWKLLLMAAVVSLALLLLAGFWFFATPVMAVAIPVSNILTTGLFDLGGGAIAWIFSPVNNIAGLLVVCLKLARVAWKRIGRVA